MKNKALIVIVVILSVILLAGIVICVILSAPKEGPTQEQPTVPTVTEVQVPATQEPVDDAFITEATQEVPETETVAPIQETEDVEIEVTQEVPETIPEETQKIPEETQKIPEETEKKPDTPKQTEPVKETEATQPEEETRPPIYDENLGPNELPGFY